MFSNHIMIQVLHSGWVAAAGLACALAAPARAETAPDFYEPDDQPSQARWIATNGSPQE